MKVDWAGADGATARQRDTGALAAGEQRAKNERGGPHRFYNFVGYFRRERTSAADSGAMVRATEAQLHFRSHCSHPPAPAPHLPHPRPPPHPPPPPPHPPPPPPRPPPPPPPAAP